MRFQQMRIAELSLGSTHLAKQIALAKLFKHTVAVCSRSPSRSSSCFSSSSSLRTTLRRLRLCDADSRTSCTKTGTKPRVVVVYATEPCRGEHVKPVGYKSCGSPEVAGRV